MAGVYKFILLYTRQFRLLVGGLVRHRRCKPASRIAAFLTHHRINLILDVGGHHGEFGLALRRHGYQGEIRSFEPVAESFSILQRRAVSDPKWHVFGFALGDVNASADIAVTRFSQMASLLPLSHNARALGRHADILSRERITIHRLDDIVATSPELRVFLKIDTQGFERQVLEGAEALLECCQGVMLELPLIQLYEDRWNLSEALDFMERNNFVLGQIHPVAYDPSDQVALLEVDGLFRRRDKRDGASS